MDTSKKTRGYRMSEERCQETAPLFSPILSGGMLLSPILPERDSLLPCTTAVPVSRSSPEEERPATIIHRDSRRFGPVHFNRTETYRVFGDGEKLQSIEVRTGAARSGRARLDPSFPLPALGGWKRGFVQDPIAFWIQGVRGRKVYVSEEKDAPRSMWMTLQEAGVRLSPAEGTRRKLTASRIVVLGLCPCPSTRRGDCSEQSVREDELMQEVFGGEDGELGPANVTLELCLRRLFYSCGMDPRECRVPAISRPRDAELCMFFCVDWRQRTRCLTSL